MGQAMKQHLVSLKFCSKWSRNIWSTGVKLVDECEKLEEEFSNAQKIKRRNWENVKMFGPLLQSSSKLRKKPNFKNEPRKVDIVTAECVENGYRDLDSPITGREIRTKILEIDTRTDKKIESNIAVDTKTVNSEFCFPGYMFDIPDKPTTPRSLVNDTPKPRSLPAAVTPLENNQLEDVLNVNLDEPNKGTELTGSVARFPLFYVQGDEAKMAAIQGRMAKLWHEYGAANLYPSVSTVLQKTMPQESVNALEKWKNAMIQKLGLEGFNEYQQETLRVGTNLHRNIAELLRGRPEDEMEIDDRNKGHWKSIGTILDKVSEVQLLEERVRHPYLHYCGTVDCVAKYSGATVLFEWKTSEKPKPLLNNMFDNPVQVAAYLGALNCGNKLEDQIDHALLVVAYPSGARAHVHRMSRQVCQRYWKVWLERLDTYIRKFLIKS